MNKLLNIGVLIGMLSLWAPSAVWSVESPTVEPDLEQKVQRMGQDFKNQLQLLNIAVADIQDTLNLLWSAENPDRELLIGKQIELDVLIRQLAEAKIDFQFALREVLTLEQTQAYYHQLMCDEVEHHLSCSDCQEILDNTDEVSS